MVWEGIGAACEGGTVGAKGTEPRQEYAAPQPRSVKIRGKGLVGIKFPSKIPLPYRPEPSPVRNNIYAWEGMGVW